MQKVTSDPATPPDTPDPAAQKARLIAIISRTNQQEKEEEKKKQEQQEQKEADAALEWERELASAAAAAAAAAAEAESWEKYFDEDQNEYYYYNTSTGAVQWPCPTGFSGAPTPRDAQSPCAPNEAKPDAAAASPVAPGPTAASRATPVVMETPAEEAFRRSGGSLPAGVHGAAGAVPPSPGFGPMGAPASASSPPASPLTALDLELERADSIPPPVRRRRKSAPRLVCLLVARQSDTARGLESRCRPHR